MLNVINFNMTSFFQNGAQISVFANIVNFCTL